jgi:hypothetical protein
MIPSIAKRLDQFDIAQQVRFERQNHKGTFLLLEGDTDIDRFEKFVDQIECSLVNCYGKPNLIGAVEALYEEGFDGVLGIADADFDRLLGRLLQHGGVIFSESHDLDLDWATDTVLARYMNSVADKTKLNGAGGIREIRRTIHKTMIPLSALRLCAHTKEVSLRLDTLHFDRFVVGLSLDTGKLLDEVLFAGTPEAKRQYVVERIEALSQRKYDPAQFHSGHDFYTILGIALRDELGARKGPQTYGGEIALHLRLTYDDAAFRGSAVCREILRWEKDNSPYLVLDSRFR